MTPEEALQLRGKWRRQSAQRLLMAAIARNYGFMGGWLGFPNQPLFDRKEFGILVLVGIEWTALN